MGFIGQQVQSQSQLLSYIDAHYALGLIAALMIPLALTLRPVDRKSQSPAA